MKISVVTPAYKTKSTIAALIERVSRALESNGFMDYEIIFVNDACPENSWEEIYKHCKQNHKVKGIKLSRNFGQQMAISVGMRHATGDVVVIMDCDLQNPPEVLPQMIAKINEGYDIVNTVSKTRNNFSNELTSKIFWWLMNDIFKLEMVPHQLMLKAFSKKFNVIYSEYNEKVRVVAGITQDIGLNQYTMEVENSRRDSGKGSYSFLKRFHLMLDIILAITTKPLNYLINLSILSLLVTFIFSVYNIITYFMYPTMPKGYTTIVLLILFFGSLTTLILGIIGRYLANIYTEVRQRPTFIIDEKLNY